MRIGKKLLMVNRKIPKDNCSERGQSFAELALTLVVLLILIAGIVDLGRAFFTYIALRDAAQEAAVYGSINPADSSGINSRGMAVLTNRIDTSTVSILPTFSGACANGSNTIQVVVQFSNFNITMPFLGTLVGSQNFNITASVTDTILSPMCP
jgi:Flp pilus assembly protein TadG